MASHLAVPRPATGIFRALSIFVTFNIVTLLWVLFRAADLSVAMRVVSGAFVAPIGEPEAFVASKAYTLALLALLFIWHGFDGHSQIRRLTESLRAEVLWPLVALICILAVTLNVKTTSKFILFRLLGIQST